MSEFYAKTSPVHYIFHCHMKTISCRAQWQIKRSAHGSCLTLNPDQIYIERYEQQRQQQEEMRLKVPLVSDSMFDLMMSSTKLPSAHETKEIDFVVGQGLWIIVALIEYRPIKP